MICHQCWKEIPAGAARCPACGAAAQPALRAAGASSGRRLDGCKFESASPRDYRATPYGGALPRQVDLRPPCSPVEDQGPLGSCAANAACGALEYQLKKSGRFAGPMSRLFVYFNARRLRGSPGEDSGVSISEVMAALLAYGAPPETDWPYDVNAFARQPPDRAYGNAKPGQPPEYARVDGSAGVQTALAHGLPVVFGFALPLRCYEEGGRTGTIPEPNAGERAGHAAGDGHSMLIVGYDLERRTYLLRNSWGSNWGEGGHARIAISVMDAYVPPGDYWILGNLEAAGAFRVSRPEAAAPALAGSVAGKAEAMRQDIRAGLSADMDAAARAIRDRIRRPPPGR